MNADATTKDEIKITVTFPLGLKPYQDTFAAATTVGSVRSAAMAGFGVVEDPGLAFYLVHANQRVDDSTTIGAIAGHAAAVKFTLTREVIQG